MKTSRAAHRDEFPLSLSRWLEIMNGSQETRQVRHRKVEQVETLSFTLVVEDASNQRRGASCNLEQCAWKSQPYMGTDSRSAVYPANWD